MQGVEIGMMRSAMSVTDIDAAVAFWGKLDIELLWRWPDDVGGKGKGEGPTELHSFAVEFHEICTYAVRTGLVR